MIVHNLDQPGHVAEVTSMLSHKCVNIAAMQLYRSSRGGYAVMVVECDRGNSKRWHRMAETCRRYRKGNISWHRIADVADMI